jgi:hypothetical protein
LATAIWKIQITECDEFTWRAPERQAAYQAMSAKQYIVHAAMCMASNEEGSFLNPETGEAVAKGLIEIQITKDGQNRDPTFVFPLNHARKSTSILQKPIA